MTDKRSVLGRIQGYSVVRTDGGSAGLAINLGLMAVLALGLRLSLAPPRREP